MSMEISSLTQIYEELKQDDVQITDIYSFTHPTKTNNKSIRLSLGRIWFNLLIPDIYPILISEPITKKRLNEIILEIVNLSDAETAANTLTQLNINAFKLAAIIPQSINIGDIIVSEKIMNERNLRLNNNTPLEKYSTELTKLANEYIDSDIPINCGISNIIKSGAKTSPTDLGVLQLSKGPTIDIEDNISNPITSALSEGYTGKEYYTAAADARRTLFIRAVGTSEPGYLAKTVVFANSNTKLSEINDCGTNKFLEIFIKPGMEKRIIGRWMLNTRTGKLIEITEESQVVNTVIQLRSPTYCKAKDGICSICYGNLSKKLDTKHLGLLAGSAINTAGLEGFSMKARHQSVTVNIKEVDFTKDIL